MTKRISGRLVWMAVVTTLASCSGGGNTPTGTPSATLSSASSVPAMGSTSGSALVSASGTEGPASASVSGTPEMATASSSTEPVASTSPSGASSDSVPADICPEVPAPLATTGSTLEFSTELELGGAPFVYGEPNALAGGGTLMPLNFRFYVSEVTLVRADSTEVKVDIVTEAGAPIPYGIQLVNAEEPSSMRFRVLAPPGSYSGASFLLGVKDACDSGFPGDGPFAASTGMTWDHGFGYLFLRYEGTVSDADADADADASVDAGAGADEAAPPAIHMGGLQSVLLAPRVQAPGEFTVVESAAASVRLVFDVDALFEGATSSLDLSDINPLLPPDPEVALGERVRRLAPELSLFTLEPQ